MAQEQKQESHHVVGTSLPPGGLAHGCAHGVSEYRAYVDFGKLPNPDCPHIQKWNTETASIRAALSGDPNK